MDRLGYRKVKAVVPCQAWLRVKAGPRGHRGDWDWTGALNPQLVAASLVGPEGFVCASHCRADRPLARRWSSWTGWEALSCFDGAP